MITGVQLDAGQKVNIGSSSAWVLPNPEDNAFYFEFTGQGLSELREALRTKKSMMATLGAGMLATDKSGVESAQTAGIHRAGENSVLASISQSISIGLTHVLERLRDWSNITGDVKIELNRDFVSNSMTAQDLTALVQSWQSGAISQQTLFANLQAGDIIAPDIKIGYANLIDKATLSATGVSENLPASNLKTLSRSRVFRGTANSQTIEITFSSASMVGYVALWCPTFDLIDTDNFDATIYNGASVVHSVTNALQSAFFDEVSATKVVLTIRIGIVFDLSRIFVGRVFMPTHNLEFGFSTKFQDLSEAQRTEDGSLHNKLPRRKRRGI